MKITTLIILTFWINLIYSQTDDFERFLLNGKTELKKEDETQNYLNAAQFLEKAVKLRPDNSEAHYFLGYAYSRLNSKDGETMIKVSLPMTLKSSEQFELVNKLTPKYKGEIFILDPYSKLTAEWGSLAMSYWNNNKMDSSTWAFKEGKKRGGYSDFILSINRAVLDNCSDSSILISSGDNFSMPLWYLQLVEGYRKDVSIVDISMLNASWYPSLIVDRAAVKFDLPKTMLDTIQYCRWKDSIITIKNDRTNKSLIWCVKPSYYNHYLLRGDILFLSLLKENKFKREIFFTTAFYEESRLSLKDFLLSIILVDKLNVDKESQISFEQYITKVSKILNMLHTANKNSPDEINMINYVRYDILNRIKLCLDSGEIRNAQKLKKMLTKYASDKKYPYHSEELLKYSKYIFKEIKIYRLQSWLIGS